MSGGMPECTDDTRPTYADTMHAPDPSPPLAETATFRDRVVAIVRAIPRGRVATYGQVALMAGAPRAARQVGGILQRHAEREQLPWQRVINASGGISTHKIGAGHLQEALLRAEGVEVGPEGVDVQRYGWRPALDAAPPAR